VVRDVRRYTFSVFDRWGQIIYETNDPLKGWDGTVKNVKAQSDVYIYLIKYMDQQYLWYEKRGHFSLLR